MRPKERRLAPVQVVALLAMLGVDIPPPFEPMDPPRAFRAAAWLWFNRDSALRLGA
jgi:hypothetical protein